MARIRSLKPEAFQSETLADVSLAAERTFFGLSTQVDDRGRIADKPASINGALWAERSERIEHTTADLDAELKELDAAGAICRYVGCDGKRYLHFVTWDDHQRVDKPSKPRTPRCRLHQAAPDECGKHSKEPCPMPDPREDSKRAREGSRALDSHETDTSRAADSESAHVDWHDSTEQPLATVIALHEPSDLEEHETLASPREDSRALPEGSMTYDLGPRTEDLYAPSADAAASGEQGALIVVREQPKPKRKPRKKPGRTPNHDLADELTNGYWERYAAGSAQKWIAIRQIILDALDNGAPRNEIAWALDRIGREGKPVTSRTLTFALGDVRRARGLAAPTGGTVDRKQQATNEQFDRAMQRAIAKEAAS